MQQIIEVSQVSSDEQTDLGQFMSILSRIDKITPLNSEQFQPSSITSLNDARKEYRSSVV
ncbi:hypothetical protein P7F88_09755 [Vibrio hannami]|uniref:hypothetical protein n=1 Tax=Vibrio hannami TaxID=2717094 RepID=UPI00240FD816|nr:hypothetical protein [Vibrio hannami]MDG3086376.1 hypothetical protein [Vibrio hannami]